MSAVQELRLSDGAFSPFESKSAALVDAALANVREKIAADMRAYLEAEMKNVQVRIEAIDGEINAMINDFSIPVERVIKKRVEMAELDAFSKGLQFALDGLKPSTVS